MVRSLSMRTLKVANSRKPTTDVLFLEYFESDFTLRKFDFPRGWVGGNHPSDFKLLPTPLKPEWIWNPGRDIGRMWYRTSFKVDGGFMPASFLVSTGAPSWFWHNDRYGHDLSIERSVLTVRSLYLF
jgi:hypothetical protein